ncbi:hypothetical protein DFH08DRAFT_963494 [Mycena albidolilacea]|uniref:Uncharacterized protein n=1 Tax=Mycena albidolilacea TaxID=1033008 RepID=A0AAD6ZUP7_9AGAR|nr:hypothetical protein DFH08DRAFT_963494 [Mycena albidolilacea]
MAGAKKSATSAPKPASSDASLRSCSSAASAISRISDTVVRVGKRAVKLTEKAAAAVKVVVISDDSEEEPELVDPQVQDQAELDALKAKWTSPIYGFFRSDVTIDYTDGRKYHFFQCVARHCKSKENGVKRYQDNTDRSSTSNLKKHARQCFGAAAVNSAIEGKTQPRPDGSIFEAFARTGQAQTTSTSRTLSDAEIRANLVRWVTESNRPITISKTRLSGTFSSPGDQQPRFHLDSFWRKTSKKLSQP